MPEYKDSFVKIKFDYCKFIRMYEKDRLISDFRKKNLGCDSNPQKYYILWNRVKIINFPYFEFISVVGLGGQNHHLVADLGTKVDSLYRETNWTMISFDFWKDRAFVSLTFSTQISDVLGQALFGFACLSLFLWC